MVAIRQCIMAIPQEKAISKKEYRILDWCCLDVLMSDGVSQIIECCALHQEKIGLIQVTRY